MPEFPPVCFKRGQTFAFVMMIPTTVADGVLATWTPKAQLRRHKNNTRDGLIANISCSWADPLTSRFVFISHNLTKDWPIGLADLDIQFQSSNGFIIQSTTTQLNIIPGVTQ